MVVLPLELEAWYNTTFPVGGNDGAVWRGRGATVASRAGVRFGWHALTATFAPIAFWAENRSFPLMANGRPGEFRFADGRAWLISDYPQRFGDGFYARLDPGQSTLRADLFGLGAGVSTANDWWGPMHVYPYVLGNNAAGIPRFFLGTSAPIDIGIGRLHGRLMFGELEQTQYFEVADTARRRYASAIVAVYTPRGMESLELGGARFFDGMWPRDGIGASEILLPVRKALSKIGDTGVPGVGTGLEDVYNQLASVFARWVFPGSGFELYGEYGREDHSWNARDFILSPDHSATLGIGVAKAWRAAGRVMELRGELMNARYGAVTGRPGNGIWYTHHIVRQGHTHLGQVLGSPLAVGSIAGATLSFTRHAALEDMTITWSRSVRRDFNVPTTWPVRIVYEDQPEPDVVHTLMAERAAVRGRMRLSYSARVDYEFNRDFGGDRLNFGLAAQLSRR